jgi:hypothetical protein
MVNTGKCCFGLNDNGIFFFDPGADADDGVDYQATFTLNTSDFGIQQEKRFWYLYFAYDGGADSFTVSVKCDDDDYGWIDYQAEPVKTGLQRVRVPVGRGRKGLMWSVMVTGNRPFAISRITGHILPLTQKGFR